MANVTRVLYGSEVSELTEYTGAEGIIIGKSTDLEVNAEAILSGTLGGTSSHTHPNKYVLDGLSVTSEDLLQYYNLDLNIPLTQEDW